MRVQRSRVPACQHPRRPPHRAEARHEIPSTTHALEIIAAVALTQPDTHPVCQPMLDPSALPRPRANRTHRELADPLRLVVALHGPSLAHQPVTAHHPNVTILPESVSTRDTLPDRSAAFRSRESVAPSGNWPPGSVPTGHPIDRRPSDAVTSTRSGSASRSATLRPLLGSAARGESAGRSTLPSGAEPALRADRPGLPKQLAAAGAAHCPPSSSIGCRSASRRPFTRAITGDPGRCGGSDGPSTGRGCSCQLAIPMIQVRLRHVRRLLATRGIGNRGPVPRTCCRCDRRAHAVGDGVGDVRVATGRREGCQLAATPDPRRGPAEAGTGGVVLPARYDVGMERVRIYHNPN